MSCGRKKISTFDQDFKLILSCSSCSDTAKAKVKHASKVSL